MLARRDDDDRAVQRMAATQGVAGRLRAEWARQGMAASLIEIKLAPVRRAYAQDAAAVRADAQWQEWPAPRSGDEIPVAFDRARA